ncbi:MAG: radical SAM protein, partial [Desulfobacterales bacterium]|nr:radical SAM protein [Desulfobacterales bacterium]
MKVLLISANTEQINVPVMPYGMACVAEAVKQAGYLVKTVNLMTKSDEVSILEQVLLSFQPDVIGISVRNIDDQTMDPPRFLVDQVKPIVDLCRRFCEAPLVLGGAGYSIFPRSVLKYLKADFGIQGEGEASFVELLNHLKKNKPLAKIPGLYQRDSTHSPKRTLQKNLDSFPFPAPEKDLNVHPDFDAKQIWLPFQTRRGCPMDCSYCSTAAIEGRVIRKYSPKQAVDALDRYSDAGFTQFFFSDNIFNLPASHAMALCDQIIEKRLNIKWQAIIYPSKIDERMAEKMAQAGCVHVALGFESGSLNILENLNKKFTPEVIKSVSKIFKKHGISRMGFLLLGGPGETKETVIQSFEFADSLELEMMKVTTGIRIYPNTKLAQIAVQEKIITPNDDLLFPKFY